MTGPEHYAEAERITDNASTVTDNASAAVMLAAAQVHATLALAAATSYAAVEAYCGDQSERAHAWAGVA